MKNIIHRALDDTVISIGFEVQTKAGAFWACADMRDRKARFDSELRSLALERIKERNGKSFGELASEWERTELAKDALALQSP